jgi:hypothetical protein
MDIFKEQLLVLGDRKAYRLMHALMIVFFTLTVLYLGGGDFTLGILFLLTSVFFYFYKKRFYTEYEYAVTNGELDIDIIQEQRKRSKALSLPVRDIELLAPVTSERYRRMPGKRLVKRMYPRGSAGREYALIHKGTEYRVKPNDEMMRTLRGYNPKNIEG